MPRSVEWMSSTDVMKMLGVTLPIVYRMIDQDGLPAYKIGWLIRFQRHEVEAFLETRRVKPGTITHLANG